MKRRVSRENAFLAQFELSFGHTDLDELLVTVQEYGEYRLDAFAEGLLRLYATHAAEVDAEIDREDAADATADAPDPTGDPDKKA